MRGIIISISSLLFFSLVLVQGEDGDRDTTPSLNLTGTTEGITGTTTVTAGCPEECTLPKNSGGRGKKVFRRYYYSVEEGECRKFQWTGRNGNANKFFRKEECRAKCEIPPCGKGNNNGQGNEEPSKEEDSKEKAGESEDFSKARGK